MELKKEVWYVPEEIFNGVWLGASTDALEACVSNLSLEASGVCLFAKGWMTGYGPVCASWQRRYA